MVVDLSREDIINLLRGTYPGWDVMDKIPEDLGCEIGGSVGEWEWNISVNNPHTDEELFEIYLMCKKS